MEVPDRNLPTLSTERRRTTPSTDGRHGTKRRGRRKRRDRKGIVTPPKRIGTFVGSDLARARPERGREGMARTGPWESRALL